MGRLLRAPDLDFSPVLTTNHTFQACYHRFIEIQILIVTFGTCIKIYLHEYKHAKCWYSGS